MKSVIHTPTNNLQNSLEFYEKLNFNVISKKDPTLVTDGKVVIEINPDRYVRAGVKLTKKSWSAEVNKLKKLTHVNKMKGDFLLSDPSGVWIYLLESESDEALEPSKEPFSILGNYMGVSLESTDMKKSVEFWKQLGFKINGSADDGWVTAVSDDGLTVSIMQPLSCPHLFFNPSLTYFNGKENNPKIIKKIRDLKIPIAEEITHFNDKGIVDNIIIRDPGGYGFFIFND